MIKYVIRRQRDFIYRERDGTVEPRERERELAVWSLTGNDVF